MIKSTRLERVEAACAHRATRPSPPTTQSQEEPSPFALPPRTLDCLRELVESLDIQRVFEFGSGESTTLFLNAGCQVTSLEDSPDWLNKTINSIPAVHRDRFTPLCQPLETVFTGAAPVRSWRITDPITSALREAQLVLIDSPAYPPFREHALVESLRTARDSIIVLDDAGIPTIRRFCTRLATRNQLPHFFSSTDHGLFFCEPPEDNRNLTLSRGPGETLKTWRRLFMAR